jgi:hypothetical protein
MDTEEPRITDDSELIRLPIRPRLPSFSASGRYVILKLATVVVFLVSLSIRSYPALSAFLILTAALLEFWICKNADGLALVGMRWSHEISEHGNPSWVFYSRKDPYVPDRAQASLFWSGLFLTSLVWFALLFVSSFQWEWFTSMLCALVFAAELTNAFCFLRCHSVSAKQADDVARSVLLGDVFDSDTLDLDVDRQPTGEDPTAN